MRGVERPQATLFSYVALEERIPATHPLRILRPMVDTALAAPSPTFDAIYQVGGRPSIPPEQLLRALLLQVLYTVRSERQLMEQLQYNLLFRWFVGLGMDELVWDVTVFAKNRERLLAGEVAEGFFAAVLAQAQRVGLLSAEHFTVDGTLVQAWAGQKTFRRDPTKPADGSDDRSGTGARDEAAARPGHIAKRDNEYRRCGTANIFAVVEPKAGRHFTCATPNRSAAQFARVVQRVVAAYPAARTIHMVMDNLNIHCEKSLTYHLGRRTGKSIWRRLTVHFTPKHGSWLNQAEIELSLVSRGCLGTRRLRSLAELRDEPRAWNTRANRARTRIQWRFTRKEARIKFGYQKNLSTRSKT